MTDLEIWWLAYLAALSAGDCSAEAHMKADVALENYRWKEDSLNE